MSSFDLFTGVYKTFKLSLSNFIFTFSQGVFIEKNQVKLLKKNILSNKVLKCCLMKTISKTSRLHDEKFLIACSSIFNNVNLVIKKITR